MTAISTGLTFLKNFSVPCMYVALAGGIAGASVGAYTMHRLDAGSLAESRLELSDYKLATETAKANAVTVALERQRAAYDQEQAQRDEIRDDLQAGTQTILQQMEKFGDDLSKQIATSIAAPEWACLRAVLPDDTAGLFERPGN